MEYRIESAPTYNLEVEDWHTYFVAEREGDPCILVHNEDLAEWTRRFEGLSQTAAQRASDRAAKLRAAFGGQGGIYRLYHPKFGWYVGRTVDFATRGFGTASHPKASFLLGQPGTIMKVRPLELPASRPDYYLDIEEQLAVDRMRKKKGAGRMLNNPDKFIDLEKPKWVERAEANRELMKRNKSRGWRMICP